MKLRYEALDGLRGTAALSVVVFHLIELVLKPAHNPVYHTFLAVDFFFILSGFVIGYAYDDRLAPDAAPGLRVGLKDFFLRRLIRLHPLVIVGVIAGLCQYLLDPHRGPEHALGSSVSYGLLFLNICLAMLVLPSPSLPHTFRMLHSLNGPAWSLTLEYLANVLYGLFGFRLGRKGLGVVWLLGAVALIVTAFQFKDLNRGASWNGAWVGLIRMMASFTAGLLIRRLNLKIRIPLPYPLLSLVLLAVFCAPLVYAWRRYYELLCILVILPLVVMAGAGETEAKGFWGKVSRLSGRLSYPVYILHYPFVFLFWHWRLSRHPSPMLTWSVVAVTVCIVIVVSWLVLVFYDEPVRAWLTRKLQRREEAGSQKMRVEAELAGVSE